MNHYFKDLTGQRFGKLVAVKDIEHRGNHKPVKWLCKCDCGGERIVDSQRLQRMEVTDCGCVKRNELIGMTFGNLTVIASHTAEELGLKRKRIYWECVCTCGKTIYTHRGRLLNPKYKTISCGCNSIRFHNLSDSPLYSTFYSMHERCYNPKNDHYHNYGGRGISICNEWQKPHGFLNFYYWAIKNGYKDGLTIDRINVNGNYEPSNCRWATRKEQQHNLRNNRKATIDGETKLVSEWCNQYGIHKRTFDERLKRGWSLEDALKKPVNKKFASYKKAKESG